MAHDIDARDERVHISLLAAPIYAMLIAQQRWQLIHGGIEVDEMLATLRSHAITQAYALWLQTLDAA